MPQEERDVLKGGPSSQCFDPVAWMPSIGGPRPRCPAGRVGRSHQARKKRGPSHRPFSRHTVRSSLIRGASLAPSPTSGPLHQAPGGRAPGAGAGPRRVARPERSAACLSRRPVSSDSRRGIGRQRISRPVPSGCAAGPAGWDLQAPLGRGRRWPLHARPEQDRLPRATGGGLLGSALGRCQVDDAGERSTAPRRQEPVGGTHKRLAGPSQR